MIHKSKIISLLVVMSFALILASYSVENFLPQANALTQRNSFFDSHTTTLYSGGQKVCAFHLCITTDFSKLKKAISDSQRAVSKDLPTYLKTTFNPLCYFVHIQCATNYVVPDEITRDQYLVLSTARINTIMATVSQLNATNTLYFYESGDKVVIVKDLQILHDNILADAQLAAYYSANDTNTAIQNLMVPGNTNVQILDDMAKVQNQIIYSNGPSPNKQQVSPQINQTMNQPIHQTMNQTINQKVNQYP